MIQQWMILIKITRPRDVRSIRNIKLTIDLLNLLKAARTSPPAA
jgi:hypothetical protein